MPVLLSPFCGTFPVCEPQGGDFVPLQVGTSSREVQQGLLGVVMRHQYHCTLQYFFGMRNTGVVKYASHFAVLAAQKGSLRPREQLLLAGEQRGRGLRDEQA